MCGIAGIWAYSGGPRVDRDELHRMRDAMASRGPDGAGIWTAESQDVGLAHRRLAIIDLSEAGAQPMRDPDTGNVIVYNGEIYNYRALRERLLAQGVKFRSSSDTEVLLHMYRLYGEALVEHLRGMFAFAIWDAREQALFLARDPLGIKPLYYADDGKTFRFASQVKALAAGGAISTTPSAAGWVGFYIWGHVPEPWTWLAAVRALPAGCTLTVRRGGPAPAPRRYFDLCEEIVRAESSPVPDRDAVEEALDAVSDSVRHHLVADVPVGVFLSSGRDSTLALDEDLRMRICGIRNPRARIMALEMTCYMRNQLLRGADWTGMAHSLEIRVPLVDVELLRRWLPIAVRQLPFDRQRLLEAAAPPIAEVVRR